MRQRVVNNVAGSGGKWLDVSPERFPRWVENFTERHQNAGAADEPLGVAEGAGVTAFTAPDGAVARCHPPFPESLPPFPESLPPFPESLPPAPAAPAVAAPAVAAAAAELLAAHATAPRAVGVLLVRLGGYAAGVFTGYPPQLAEAKAGSRLVHGRSAAGGWSQHRFARRREKQASQALQAAADAAVTIFGRAARLDAVVLGGDKRAIAELREDPRLARYFAIATDRFLTVPDPKRAVLEASPRLFLAVRVWLTEPAGR
jgi:hypothetical protein